jgi:methylmalonyl-CoA/ethylmalonyl-CoA epimerase
VTAPAEELAFHHVGVAVNDIDAGVGFYRDVMGYTPLGPTVADPLQGVHVCFLGRPDPREPLLELVAPIGDDSPLRATLAKGGGAYHVCFTVERLDEMLDRARDAGCLLIGHPTASVAFGGDRIAWIYSPGRQLIELAERGNEPKRPGA